MEQGRGREHQEQGGHADDIIRCVGSSNGFIGSVKANCNGGEIGTAAGVGPHEHAGDFPALKHPAAKYNAEGRGHQADAEYGAYQGHQGFA